FSPPAPPAAEPVPPDHGVLVTLAPAGSIAAQGGIKSGDLILQYAGVKVKSPAELESAAKAPRTDAKVAVQVWRDGKTFDRSMNPGRRGVVWRKNPADKAVRSRRELEQFPRLPVGDGFPRLRGAEWEMFVVPATVRSTTAVKGSEANEQRLL